MQNGIIINIGIFYSFKTIVTECLNEGHPISSDNGLISQKLSLKSTVLYPLHVAMGVDYSFVKYEVVITTGFYALRICKQHCESLWPRKITF